MGTDIDRVGSDRAIRLVHLRGLSGMSVDMELTEPTGRGRSRRWEGALRAQAPDFECEHAGGSLTHKQLGDLVEFFRQAAVQQFPELTLPAWSLPAAGIVFDVVGSSPEGITLEIRFSGDTDPEAVDGFSFDTTGLALLHAADQIRGADTDREASSRLFDPDLEQPVQALIWDAVRVPDLARLDGVALPTGEKAAPGGQLGELRGYTFAPGCDAALELDLLRLGMPHAIASILGSFGNGDRFGILLLQSDPLLDQQAWDNRTDQSPDETDLLASWDAVDVAMDAFNAAAAPAEQRAVFARLDGWRLLSAGAIGEHLIGTYPGCDAAEAERLIVRRFDEVLLALLAEAVGVPLPRVLAARDCLLPGWQHTCQHEPVADALAAWIDGTVSPEQFSEFEIRDRHLLPADDRSQTARPSQGSGQRPAPPQAYGGYEARFRSYLGSGDDAPSVVGAVFAHARRADDAERRRDDEGVLTALKDALAAVEEALAGHPPRRYVTGLRELREDLAAVVAPFPDDDPDDTARSGQ